MQALNKMFTWFLTPHLSSTEDFYVVLMFITQYPLQRWYVLVVSESFSKTFITWQLKAEAVANMACFQFQVVKSVKKNLKKCQANIISWLLQVSVLCVRCTVICFKFAPHEDVLWIVQLLLKGKSCLSIKVPPDRANRTTFKDAKSYSYSLSRL